MDIIKHSIYIFGNETHSIKLNFMCFNLWIKKITKNEIIFEVQIESIIIQFNNPLYPRQTVGVFHI